MKEKIKKAVFKKYNPEEKKGVFLSWFDKEHTLLISQWIITSEKSLQENIESLYDKFLLPKKKELYYFSCDIVSDIIEIKDIQKAFDLSPQEFWFAVMDQEDQNAWIILPNMSWVSDAKSALYYIKQKYHIHGKVEIFAFRTERITISR